jgi:hypothetical protein
MRNRFSCLRIGIIGEWIDFLGSTKLGKITWRFEWLSPEYCGVAICNKSAMTSSTGRSGCTSPETSVLSLTMVQHTSNSWSLTESAAIKVRNLCLLLRLRQWLFTDIQHRKKKHKTVLAYCLDSRDFHIERKNRKSGSLQFRQFFCKNFIFFHSIKCSHARKLIPFALAKGMCFPTNCYTSITINILIHNKYWLRSSVQVFELRTCQGNPLNSIS